MASQRGIKQIIYNDGKIFNLFNETILISVLLQCVNQITQILFKIVHLGTSGLNLTGRFKVTLLGTDL